MSSIKHKAPESSLSVQSYVVVGTWGKSESSMSELGVGGFGKVLSTCTENKDTGFAGTCFKTAPVKKKPSSSNLLKEYKVMKFLKENDTGSPFYPLVINYTLSIDNKTECIEMERLDQSLADYFESYNKTHSNQAPPKNIFFRIAVEALECILRLHSMDIYHGDVKPRNFMFDREGNLKIIDFGLSRFLEHPSLKKKQNPKKYAQCVYFDFKLQGYLKSKRSRFEGTTKYCSPRVHERLVIHPSDDIISLTYFLWEWYTQKKLPWSSSKENSKNILQMKKKWLGWNELPTEVALLYNLCKDTRMFNVEELQRLLEKMRQRSSGKPEY